MLVGREIVREIFVTEVAKEVLGPRNGIAEIMTESPLNEYITGVLAPIVQERSPDIDTEAEIPHEEAQTYEEETGDVDVHAPPLLSPGLDPTSRPSSLGLSFTVKGSGIPAIDVCLTWARYRMSKDTHNVVWEREPRYFITSVTLESNQAFWVDSDGRQTGCEKAEVSFHTIVTPRADERYLINLYFVNRMRVPDGQNPTAEYHIFQPQMRIACKPGTCVDRGIERIPNREEERELALLYRNRPVFARGFLCSAIWKEIDPENHFGGNLDFPECVNNTPFHWIDRVLLPHEERHKFSPPDIRTEFIPLYSIPAPELGWPEQYGDAPELRTEVLAELWDSDELQHVLTPLVAGYERWISDLDREISQLPNFESQIAGHLLQRCRDILNRIRRGIEFLVSDTDARLAFCFANKAIDLQSRWTRNNQGLVWRPFQLAFILMTLESIANGNSPERDVCDLLWVPTGTGKTEAYLAIAVFTIGYRRRLALMRSTGDRTGAGVSVLTRYTLRLLTIQQFRRALAVITACEYLRVRNLMSKNPVGWRPERCLRADNLLWGSAPFSIGLWVGGGVTPNKLGDTWGGNQPVFGALSILRGQYGEGEPAQVLNCPACRAILAIPEMGLKPGRYTLYFVIHARNSQRFQDAVRGLSGTYNNIQLSTARIASHRIQGYFTLGIDITVQNPVNAADIDNLWNTMHARFGEVDLVPARASRPGYFMRWYRGQKGKRVEYDFEIFCPDPACPLHHPWCGGSPAGSIYGHHPHACSPTGGLQGIPALQDGNRFCHVQQVFRDIYPYISDRIPIPAYTVDDQIYHRIPSIVVATVDKFARLPFEPRASGLFGNVEYHHCIYGFYRRHQHFSNSDSDGHPGPAGRKDRRNFIQISPPESPDLVLQDELHLIEGPLGSLVGIYETALDFLCREPGRYPIKYIASTATVRRANEQVGAVFARRLLTFPAAGLRADDRFFLRDRELNALHDTQPGRLYIGICAPGRGPLTPLIRIFARLLFVAWNARTHANIDTFWTLTGYFNAIRELAGARALYRQDIPQRLNQISGGNSRTLTEDRCQELSSRTDSTNLPAILDLLNRTCPEAQDAVFTTSMFGTGVDIPRIGLMVVSGQPKTTSAYIQSTGRVGRSGGALVVVFLRASRPRDLNHYEYFCGYHRQLHRFVEPITVYPFAPGVLERACGPLAVYILRNLRNTSVPWHQDGVAPAMRSRRTSSPEVQAIPGVMERRGQLQPAVRRPQPGNIQRFADAELDRWQQIAHRNAQNLKYVEYAIAGRPQYPVVLGDAQHRYSGVDVVYEHVPESLRDIEETIGFQT